MINKLLLQSVINKYHLGVNEAVKWEISNNTLTVKFMTPSQDVIGEVHCSNFPLEDSELAIFDTKKLLNLVTICNGDLILELGKRKDTIVKFNISDINYNLDYSLSDPLLIPKVGTVNVPEWNVELELTPDDIVNLIKAKNALSGVDDLVITTDTNMDGDSVCKFIFGGDADYSNKITYQMTGDIKVNDLRLPFNSDMFRTILNFNKDMEGGKIYLNDMGLMMLEFSNDEISCRYFTYKQSEV